MDAIMPQGVQVLEMMEEQMRGLPDPTMSFADAQGKISQIRHGTFDCRELSFDVELWYTSMRTVVNHSDTPDLSDDIIRKRYDHRVFLIAKILMVTLPNFPDEVNAMSVELNPQHLQMKWISHLMIKQYESLQSAIESSRNVQGSSVEFNKIWEVSRKLLHFSNSDEQLCKVLGRIWLRLSQKKADGELSGGFIPDEHFMMDMGSFAAVYYEILARALNLPPLDHSPDFQNQFSICTMICDVALSPLPTMYRTVIQTVGYGEQLQEIERKLGTVKTQLFCIGSDVTSLDQKLKGLVIAHFELVKCASEVLCSLEQSVVMSGLKLISGMSGGSHEGEDFSQESNVFEELKKEVQSYLAASERMLAAISMEEVD